MKKILIAMLLVAASFNVVACASSQDSSASEMSDRTKQAQNAANDSLRK